MLLGAAVTVVSRAMRAGVRRDQLGQRGGERRMIEASVASSASLVGVRIFSVS